MMVISPRILLLLLLQYPLVLLADPAFFQQREWIRNQSQPPTSPYQQAARQERAIPEKVGEYQQLKNDPAFQDFPFMTPPDDSDD